MIGPSSNPQVPRDSSPLTRRNLLRAGALAGAGLVAAQWWSPQQAAAAPAGGAGDRASTLDMVVFGDAASETAHALTTELSGRVRDS